MNETKESFFTMVKRGYDPDEVKAYIEELESKCSYFQTRNTELEQKLDTARRLIRRFSGMENDLRQNIADSKRAAAAMISDTKERSETLLDKTRESCGEIISDLDMQINQRMGTIDVMKAAVATFKDQLFEMYSSHIELIEALSQNAESFNYEPDYSEVAEAVEQFEASGDPECDMPEFKEYPEESIFEELKEAEAEEAAREFVLDDAAQESEEKEDTSDYEYAAGDNDQKAEDGGGENEEFSVENTGSEAADVEPCDNDDNFTVNGEAFAENASNEAEEKTADERSDEDYFKFLNEFANGDSEEQ